MVHEFEGRSEKEAIDAAAEELRLERDGFDVEILESQTGSIFKKGKSGFACTPVMSLLLPPIESKRVILFLPTSSRQRCWILRSA